MVGSDRLSGTTAGWGWVQSKSMQGTHRGEALRQSDRVTRSSRWHGEERDTGDRDRGAVRAVDCPRSVRGRRLRFAGVAGQTRADGEMMGCTATAIRIQDGYIHTCSGSLCIR